MFETTLSRQEKLTNEEVYRRQVELLKLFWEKRIIKQEQFAKAITI